MVLRSIRYGEADRILHLYTPDRGRVGAIAKGVRRARSRFGGRLEPFFRAAPRPARGPRRALHGHRGGDRRTPTRACARTARALERAARACDAVPRLFETGEPHPEVFNLLCHELALLDAEPGAARRAPTSSRSASSCCSPPGFAPQLSACASCGEREHLGGFSPRAPAASSAPACEAGAFALDEEAHAFLVGALGRPLAEAPRRPTAPCARPSGRSPRRVEHHAHVRLRAAAAG